MHVHISFKEALKAACLVGTPGPLWGRALPQNGTPTMISDADINAFVEASETGEYVEMSLVIARPFAGAPRGGGGARPICSADAPAGGAPKVRGAGVGAPAGRDGAASMDA